LTLKQRNLRFVLEKTVVDILKAEVDKNRANLMTDLLNIYDETGNKSFSVHIPGAEKVATITIAEPKPTTKVDDEALLAWCREHRPDLLEAVHHPAQEAWDEVKLRDTAAAELAKASKLAGTLYMTEDGELIDGIEYEPAGRPKSFTVRYEGGKDGQQRVIDAWKSGELAEITSNVLPQIEA
jgi:hypothetical protein